MKKKYFLVSVVLIMTGLIFTACASVSSTHSNKKIPEETTSAKSPQEMGVIINVDDENSNITLGNIEGGDKTIYAYNSGTTVYTKSGNVMSLSGLEAGDIVDISYNPKSYVVEKIRISDDKDIWENTKVTSFSVDDSTRSMKIGQSLYSYTDSTFVFSNGERIDISELNSQDRLIVRGYKTKVVSIVVDKGHGYISLTGEQLFVGGYIDVGGKIVKVIEDEMLIIVQEGSYKVEVRNGAYIADKQVQVTRDRNTVVDFSDVAPIVTSTGSVKFNINADDADLYVDGIKKNASEVLTLTAGNHKVKVTAEGYYEYSDTVEIESKYQIIDIILKKDGESETQTESRTETETESVQETQTNSSGDVISQINDVTVSGPEGAYVYFDGKYMGIAPVTFDMVTGSHVISILYNSEIKSYSVNLAEGGDDVTYDFTDK